MGGDMEEGQGLEYWMRWQVPVSALAFLLPAAIAFPLLLSREKKSSVKLIELWIPCWRSFHPVYLLFYRAIVLCITSSILACLLVRRGFLEFYFYTQYFPLSFFSLPLSLCYFPPLKVNKNLGKLDFIFFAIKELRLCFPLLLQSMR